MQGRRSRVLVGTSRLWERHIEGTRRLADFVARGYASSGRFTYGNPIVRSFNGQNGRVDVGSFVSFARGVEILLGGEHHPEWVSTFPLRVGLNLPSQYLDGQPRTRGDVHVGSDVWVGTRSMILSGVVIGDGAVIAAGSVVTKDVAPYAIAGGVPATTIRMRFPDSIVEALLRVAWWHWPLEEISEAALLLGSSDVEKFIERYGTS